MADFSPATLITLPELVRLQADARALKLPSVKPVRSRQAGLRQSRQKGRGMTFSEVRQYQPGDDIRSIDWRVTARRQAPHTKLYEEERERPVLLIVDLGPTLFFASAGAYKQVRGGAQVAALLAWLALWAGDQVGGAWYSMTGTWPYSGPPGAVSPSCAFWITWPTTSTRAKHHRPPLQRTPAMGWTQRWQKPAGSHTPVPAFLSSVTS